MKIVSRLINNLKLLGVECITRSDSPEMWAKVFSELHYQPNEYSAEMINYQHAYSQSAGYNITDCSLILLSGGKAFGLWVLTVGQLEDEYFLTSCGFPIHSPIFLKTAQRKLIKRTCVSLMQLLSKPSSIGIKTEIVIQQNSWPEVVRSGCSDWHLQALANGAVPTVKYDLFVNLIPSLKEVKSSFRKSYKPLINKGIREWSSLILTSDNIKPSIWLEFKRLHEEVAGRITRNTETWDLQYKMILSGHAFLVSLRNKEEASLVGGGFFQMTRDEGIYSVGAYNRTLFAKPLGHVVQQLAIEHMKSCGLTWYRVGERVYSQNRPTPTKKEIDVSFFKAGFANCTLYRFDFALPPS